MSTVTISADYQIVLPPEVRDQMALRPGQEMTIVCYRDHVALMPLRPIQTLRGLVPGIDTVVPRDEDRV